MSHIQQSKVSASRIQRGASGERKTTEALARLHSARSFNHSHCFTAEGWGSSLTPLGLRSFDEGHLPLLGPMSEVAGRMSVQIGAHYLQKSEGGRGVLMGGVPGVLPAKTVVIGGGVVGVNALKILPSLNY